VTTTGSADDGYRFKRRVPFHETDLAGIVHFSWFFRYMEEAEHALWRAAGLSIDRAGAETGWPRVSASFDFKNALFFEDEFEVVVRVATVTRRTIQYAFVVMRGDTTIGTGAMTAACARKQPGLPLQAVDVLPDIVAKLRAAAGQSPS
jgi:YbgC/YbaW family acyl-CoA thioester hydrolase